MQEFFVYVAILFLLIPLSSYADSGIIPIDFAGVEISYDIDGIIVLDAYFDEDFESLVFVLNADEKSGSIILNLDQSLFGYPIGLDMYYVQADAEPIEAQHTKDDQIVQLSIDVNAGVTSVEIFGKISEIDTTIVEIIEEPQRSIDKLPIVCESGMIMVNDQCIVQKNTVLDETICGEGTVFKDERCIIKPIDTLVQDQSCTKNKSIPIISCFKDLVYGIVGAISIALVVAIIFLAMSKASRKTRHN
ncbi:MAG: putative membrane protein [Cenarchaeum symbiont of Oopsacas minuta]|nr:putative membrane protein [Cenarchaeum symbiont of Oopsacas minuta]